MEYKQYFYKNLLCNLSEYQVHELLKNNNKKFSEYEEQIKENANFEDTKVEYCLLSRSNTYKIGCIYVIEISGSYAYFLYVKKEDIISDLVYDLIVNKKVSSYVDENCILMGSLSPFTSRLKLIAEEKADLKKKVEDEINSFTVVKRLRRNKKIVNRFLDSQQKICWICGTEVTFERENGDQYFEVHHIIPYNTISKAVLGMSLDISDNLSLLCPTCHRMIHFIKKSARPVAILKILCKNSLMLNKLKNHFGSLDDDDIVHILNTIYEKTFNLS